MTLISILFDLLAHPWWLVAVAGGLALGAWLMVLANDQAIREQRQREIDQLCRDAEAEWRRLQTETSIHRAARSIRDGRA